MFDTAMPIPQLVFLIVLIAASYASYKTGKLTEGGAITGGFIGLCVYLGTGYTGIAMLAVFFVLSTLATSHKKKEKRLLGEAEHPQKRDARQVLANGGLPALLGILATAMPDNTLLATVFMAAAFASATADTLSSELGTVYGKRFYNILTFKPDEKGRDGVISLEGTLTGIAGSAIIAFIYVLFFGWSPVFWVVITSGTAGNLFDSLLGATLERKGYIKNNLVNFLNTAFAALVAYLLLLI